MEIEESEKKPKDNFSQPIPILVIYDDIPQINEIIISFWGKKSVYDYNFYYKVLSSNLSYAYKMDKELIAVCLVELDIRKKLISIALLCVKKAYQRNGLGKSLLNYCLNNCIKKGYSEIFLHVATTNTPAIKLYKKLGFKEIDIIKGYYFNDSPPDRDAYLMKYQSNNSDYKNKELIRGKSSDNYKNYNNKKYYDNFKNYDNRYFEHYNNNHYNNYQYNNYYKSYYGNNNYYRNYNNNYDHSNYSHYMNGYWSRYNHIGKD